MANHSSAQSLRLASKSGVTLDSVLGAGGGRVPEGSRIDLLKYLTQLKRLLSGLPERDGKPAPLFRVHCSANGTPLGLEPIQGEIVLVRGLARLCFKERTSVLRDCALSFDCYTYQFLPLNTNTEQFRHLGFRIDKDRNERAHANTDPAVRDRFGDHLHYPEDTQVKIDDLCLYCALGISLRYEDNPAEYPFDPAYGRKYNEVIERLRKKVER